MTNCRGLFIIPHGCFAKWLIPHSYGVIDELPSICYINFMVVWIYAFLDSLQ